MQMQLIDTRGAVDCYCRWTERAWYEYHPRLGRMSPVNLPFFDFSSLLVGGLSFILSIFLSPPLFNFSSTMPATVFSRSKRKLCLCLVQREYPFLSVLTFFFIPPLLRKDVDCEVHTCAPFLPPIQCVYCVSSQFPLPLSSLSIYIGE